MKKLNFLFSDDKGSVIIIIAAAMLMFLGLTAFAVDAGYLYYHKRNMQNAADAAALASVQELPALQSVVEEKAKDFIDFHNTRGELDGVTTTNDNTAGFAVTPTAIDVTVEIWKTYSLFVAPAIGINNAKVAATATARIQTGYTNVAPFSPLTCNYKDNEEDTNNCPEITPLLKGEDQDKYSFQYYNDDGVLELVLNYDFVYGNNKDELPYDPVAHDEVYEYLRGRYFDPDLADPYLGNEDNKHKYSYLEVSYTNDGVNTSEHQVYYQPDPNNPVYYEVYFVYDEYADGIERLNDFKDYVVTREKDVIGAKIGIIAGNKGVYKDGGESIWGPIDMDYYEGKTNQPGTPEIREWLYNPPNFTESTVFGLRTGNINTLFTSQQENIEEWLQSVDGTYFVFLPHPSVVFGDGPKSELYFGDFLIAEVYTDPDGQIGCGNTNSTAVRYRLVGEIINVYNPLDPDDKNALALAGVRRIIPFLIK